MAIAEEKAARTQALFREVNERVVGITEGQVLPSEQMDVLCECCDPSCTESLSLSLDEYERIRSEPTLFPIKSGHENLEIEFVVEANERFAVVDKVGRAGEVAAAEDPRAR